MNRRKGRGKTASLLYQLSCLLLFLLLFLGSSVDVHLEGFLAGSWIVPSQFLVTGIQPMVGSFQGGPLTGLKMCVINKLIFTQKKKAHYYIKYMTSINLTSIIICLRVIKVHHTCQPRMDLQCTKRCLRFT